MHCTGVAAVRIQSGKTIASIRQSVSFRNNFVNKSACCLKLSVEKQECSLHAELLRVRPTTFRKGKASHNGTRQLSIPSSPDRFPFMRLCPTTLEVLLLPISRSTYSASIHAMVCLAPIKRYANRNRTGIAADSRRYRDFCMDEWSGAENAQRMAMG
jgi:hypothetical protein